MHGGWRTILGLLGILVLFNGRYRPALQAADHSETETLITRNPLREPRSISSPLTEGSPRANPDDLLKLQADLKGSDRARAILAIHELKGFGATGARILVQSLHEANQPMELQFPTLNAIVRIGKEATPAVVELLETPTESRPAFGWMLLQRLGPDASPAVPFLFRTLLNESGDPDDRI